MNPQSNAMSASRAAFPVSRLILWSVKRELWENRSIFLAPLAAAGIVLIGALIGLPRFLANVRGGAEMSPAMQHDAIEQAYMFAALLIMGATFVVAIFYSLGALHGERRDRSILFWKSLPVSDLTTVLSKAAIPVFVLPLITFVITIVTQWMIMLLHTMVLLGSGQGVGMLWSHVALAQMTLMEFYHLLLGHGLWYAPVYGWLLLVSAWSRRSPFLWAALPLFAIGTIEKIAFNTRHIVDVVGNRILGAGGEKASSASAMLYIDPVQTLLKPGMWIGLALTALFLVAAARLRRSQGPI
ncbi:MAG: ABC transporter permease [Acidobacteria bacterium]|nr:ABC transporter permease [Acidobacteriota bacterium]